MLLEISKTIEPAFAATLCDLAVLAQAQKIEFLVVGAMARDLIFECGFGIGVQRATRDIDFGVRVKDWGEFQALVKSLTERDWHCAPKQDHRFVHPNGVPVDLIPFGEIASKSKEIEWPPHFNEPLSVLGFEEALAHSWTVRVRLEPILDVRVASPAGQALLKLAAWKDRGARRGDRDATDLKFLMERYLDLDNFDRVVKEYPEWLDDDFDYRIASARLLGADVAKCVSKASLPDLAQLVAAVRGEKPEESLAFAMYRAGDRERIESAQSLIDAFCSSVI